MASTAAQKKAALALVADSLGITDVDALAALIAQKPTAAAKTKAEVVAPAKTFTETLDEGVAAAGFTFARGRNYISKALVEAQARALNAKRPSFEIVKSAAEGVHNAAVVVVRDDQGRVYSQNLAVSS